MSSLFEVYRPRKIEFRELIRIGDWNVKVYSITHREKFQSNRALESVLAELPKLLQTAQKSDLPTHKMAFLIVHEAREGVLILLNWWTGGEMIETEIYFSNYQTPHKIEASPFENKALVCIWELEIFAHERKAWIEHVLANSEMPKFQEYLSDTLL